MEKRDIYFILAVIIVFIIAFSLYNLTGDASLGLCSDSDNGVDYNITGTAKYENRNISYTDECITERRVKEYYCYTDLHIKSKKYTCPNACEDGACVK